MGSGLNGNVADADYAISKMPCQVPNRRHERINSRTHIPVTTHRATGKRIRSTPFRRHDLNWS